MLQRIKHAKLTGDQSTPHSGLLAAHWERIDAREHHADRQWHTREQRLSLLLVIPHHLFHRHPLWCFHICRFGHADGDE